MKQKEKVELGDWLPLEEARSFLNYKPTQMNKLLRENPQIKRSKIGRRRFVSKSSLIEFLERNVR